MLKKLLIIFVVILALVGFFGLRAALKYRDEQRVATQNAKAAQASITLVEGWDNSQIADYLQKNNITQASDFLSAEKSFDASGYPLLADNPKSADLEGFLFPDTYFIPANPLPAEDINKVIIDKALDNFSAKITTQMQSQAAADNMSLYQIITLASIIEKEAGNDQDKATISSVFYNRLKAGMPLQSDATVSYATGDKVLSDSDLQVDSPYNTYKYPGLPYGPICNPGLSSIMAALYPAQTDYLYFLTDPATGRAVFAETNDQQNQNKLKYLH